MRGMGMAKKKPAASATPSRAGKGKGAVTGKGTAPGKPVSTPVGHVFGKPRPGTDGTYPLQVSHSQALRNQTFRPVPPPTGKLPFQLDLASVLPAAAYQAIVTKRKMTFHLNG